MTRPNAGTDLQALQMSGAALVNSGGDSGTSTSINATSIGDTTKSWTNGEWNGWLVVVNSAAGLVFAVVTGTGLHTLTIADGWRTATGLSAGSAAATLPVSPQSYLIVPAMAAAVYMAFSTSATVAAADTALNGGEINNAGGALNRDICSWGHSATTNTFTLSRGPLTLVAADGTPNIQKLGIFNVAKSGFGILAWETVFTTPSGTLATSDQVTATLTVTF